MSSLLTLFSCLFVSIPVRTHGSYGVVTQICPDPNLRNEYDPRMAFNKHLGNNNYPLHPRSTDIAANIIAHIANNKVSLSMPLPIFIVEATWNEYKVIYSKYSTDITNEWTTFKCPGPDLVGTVARWPWDGAHDYPFILRDPNHPIHGTYTELRGWHTFIDHTNQLIYCDGCGLFKYNNNGEILNPYPMNTTISDGQDFPYKGKGQGTGSGLSWPGVIRREDVLSGVIAHAIRMSFSNCDFLANTWVLPAVKTDQPKDCTVTTVPDSVKIEMGYRIRLKPSVNCDIRLAPKYKNNGIWYPPTMQMTAFVRMFCRALKEYGGIPSDGAGYESVIFQAESPHTANWSQVFGAQCDETTCGVMDPITGHMEGGFGWSWMIRDYTTPSDNRYRDERYGIPWHELVVLNVSDTGDVNECCLNGSRCTSTPSPTRATWIDTTPGPQCLNENCCFKNRIIDGYELRINEDNCIIYNCTFIHIEASDAIQVYAKRDGSATNGTLIELNTFPGIAKEAIDIQKGDNTIIRNNIFPNNITGGWASVRLQNTINTTIINNTFTGSVDVFGILLCGWDSDNISVINNCVGPTGSITNTLIENNRFSGLKHGIQIQRAKDTIIRNNIFNNIDQYGITETSGTTSPTSDSIDIDGNTFNTVKSAMYLRHDSGQILIQNNIIDGTTADGIIFTGDATGAIIQNNIISNVGGTSNGIKLIQYASVIGNKMHSVTGRGIRYTGTSFNGAPNGPLIIENNIIYDIAEDTIYFQHDSSNPLDPSNIIIRFNTIISSANGEDVVYISSGFNAETDIFCNIAITNNIANFWRGNLNYMDESKNYKILYSNIDIVKFINNNNDLHLQSISPAIAYCNGMNLTQYPLSNTDYDGNTRSTNFDIDAGADQISPITTDNPTTATINPSQYPSSSPSNNPSLSPSGNPTVSPSNNPSLLPSSNPSTSPSNNPSSSPSDNPSSSPTENPTVSTINPTVFPSNNPSSSPTENPSVSNNPSISPTRDPSNVPTYIPSSSPTDNPSKTPTSQPTASPNTGNPSISPSNNPSSLPSENPTVSPSNNPSSSPSGNPTAFTINPTISPSNNPTSLPSNNPTISPSNNPSTSPTAPTTAQTTPPPTTEPACLNANCCHKHKQLGINDAITINEDNCVIYNCTFSGVDGSDQIKIISKTNGTPSIGTIIELNIFIDRDHQDVIDIRNGKDTIIRSNIFPNTVDGSRTMLRLQRADNTVIDDNVFDGDTGVPGVYLCGWDGNTNTVSSCSGPTGSITNTLIKNNTFRNLKHGVLIQRATDTIIEYNIFEDITDCGVRENYESSVTSNGLDVNGNIFKNMERAIYLRHDDGLIKIRNNMIDIMSKNGIEFTGNAVGPIIENNTISNTVYSGIYLKSHASVIDNKIYHTTQRGIYYKGQNYGSIGRTIGPLIIINNIIYDTTMDMIYLYHSGTVPTFVNISFNTIISGSGTDDPLYIKYNLDTETKVYCNIIISNKVSSGNYVYWRYSSSSYDHIDDYGNTKESYSNIGNLEFVSLVNKDFHLKTGSSAIGSCTAMNTMTYPLMITDIDGYTRSVSNGIDSGVYVTHGAFIVNHDKNQNISNIGSIKFYAVLIISFILTISCVIGVIYYYLKRKKRKKRKTNFHGDRYDIAMDKKPIDITSKRVDVSTPINVTTAKNGPVTPTTPLTMADAIELQQIRETKNIIFESEPDTPETPEDTQPSPFGAAVSKIYID